MSGYGKAVALGPGEGDEFSIGHDRVVVKGATEHSGDGFSVVEYVGANQPGPPPHVHRSCEEAWFILDGEVDFMVGGEVSEAAQARSSLCLGARLIRFRWSAIRPPVGWESSHPAGIWN